MSNTTEPEATTDTPEPVEPSPAEIFERPHPLTPLVEAWIMLAAAVLLFARELIDGNISSLDELSLPFWILLGIVILQIIIGIFRWRYIRFVVDTHEFRIDKNFIWHSSDKIIYAKIQSVDIQQPFAARLLRMAKLDIDVGSDAVKSMEFLSLKRAEQLREVLLLRSRAQQLDDHNDAVDQISPPSPVAPQPLASSPAGQALHTQEEPSVFQVNPLHLIYTAVLSFDFLFLAITQVVLLSNNFLDGAWGPSVALMIPLVSLLWTRTTNQWNYRLTRHGTTVRSSRGLFTLASQQIPHHRIQGIRISQRLLHRLLGLWRVQMTVLGVGHQQDASERSNILLPAGKWSDVEATVSAIWPGLDLNSFDWQPQPSSARWLTWLTFRTRGWAIGPDLAATRKGLFIHKIDLVPHSRIQGLRLAQGPLQRHFNLATVDVQLSTGVVQGQAGYLELPEAMALFDQLSNLSRAARENGLATEALLAFPPPLPEQQTGV